MKKVLLSLSIVLLTFTLTVCLKRDSMEDITINTTVYPIWYITNRLYGSYSTVNSIYPKGVITDEYELTDKQIKDYSSDELFIFNGLTNEKDYVNEFFKKNKNLLIIDSTNAMQYTYGVEELWLNPLNLLNMANNIKKGLNEYINYKYLKDEINSNYDEINKDLSNLAAKMQLTIEKATNKNLVIASNTLEYLKVYNSNLNIYNLDISENDPSYNKLLSNVVSLIKSDDVKYIYILQNDTNETLDYLAKTYNIEVIYINKLDNITLESVDKNEDYLTIMNDNLEKLKKQLYY